MVCRGDVMQITGQVGKMKWAEYAWLPADGGGKEIAWMCRE